MGCRKSVLPLPCEFPFVRQRSRASSLTSASCLNVPRGRTSQVKLFPARDFEIEATGFELPEIDFLVQSLDPPEIADKTDEFEPAAGPAVSCPGDL
jgi:hypothetical protein